jgi:hypothetical protein
MGENEAREEIVVAGEVLYSHDASAVRYVDHTLLGTPRPQKA